MDDDREQGSGGAPRDAMLTEARRIVDAARDRHVVLRLLGGLAVREHCRALHFCERDHADLDLVGRRRQVNDIDAVLRDLGYAEEPRVALATTNRQLQFVRACVHKSDAGAAHHLDRVDIFLDAFRMDHTIVLGERLTLEDYTIAVTDLLLTKLQIVRHNDKDVRDIITLLKDVPLAEEDLPGVVGTRSIAVRCARDWGLHHDVSVTLDLCRSLLERYELEEDERRRVAAGIDRLGAALRAAPKSLAWRARAKVGTRLRWHAPVEDQDG